MQEQALPCAVAVGVRRYDFTRRSPRPVRREQQRRCIFYYDKLWRTGVNALALPAISGSG